MMIDYDRDVPRDRPVRAASVGSTFTAHDEPHFTAAVSARRLGLGPSEPQAAQTLALRQVQVCKPDGLHHDANARCRKDLDKHTHRGRDPDRRRPGAAVTQAPTALRPLAGLAVTVQVTIGMPSTPPGDQQR